MVVYFNIFLCLIEKFLNLNIFIFTELNLFATLLSDTTKKASNTIRIPEAVKNTNNGQNSPGYRTEVLRIQRDGYREHIYIPGRIL